ncbi:RNA-guided endonuclease TnpB family protein [Actinomadura sp. KC216]|uniref:RNA-guided endonuclease InsQ/TnpB family protein n=1 Tax=Actinomadura sp. KC216 TaxID=2530370 RepID=UPI0014054A27|nr:RNA-guided endonuclease TnpB family protein [Actinomadura sp. KC216]
MTGATVFRRAYRYRLDPTPRQARMFLRSCGARRYAHNWAVDMIYSAFDERRVRTAAGIPVEDLPRALTFATLNNAFNDWKKGRTGPESRLPKWWLDRHPDLEAPEWLADHSWDVYMWAIYEVYDGLHRWFNSRTGKHGGKPLGFLSFKSKRRDSPRFKVAARPNGARPIDYRHVRLPKIGAVHTRDHMKRLVRGIEAGRVKLKQATIRQDRRGAWWIAFSVEESVATPVQPTRRMRHNGAVAIDIGVKALAVLSFGETVLNPRFMDSADRALRQAQRELARRVKGSKGHAAAQRRHARLHVKVAGLRRNYLHHLTSVLAQSFAHIAVEDLNVKGMVASARGTRAQPGRQVRQKAGLNRRIHDAAFAEIRRQLDYKTRWYGGTMAAVDRFAPTSKICSECGWRNPNLTLSDRTFHCGGCGISTDRDLNAARNIARLASEHTDHAFAQGVQAVRLRKPLPGHGQMRHFHRAANLAPRHGHSTIEAALPGLVGQTRRPGSQGPGVPDPHKPSSWQQGAQVQGPQLQSGTAH